MATAAFLAAALLGFASPAPAAPQPPPQHPLFVSPMGEPFRSDDPGHDVVGDWFADADRNRDGALTVEEMQADAARFFATLDTNHDGEIDPDELTRYETAIAPEVQVGLQMGTGGLWRGDERRRRPPPGGGFAQGLEGAGRYSFLNIPEPVIAADADLNRGVSAKEFAAAAAQRFALLDLNHDGRLTRDELPSLPQRRMGKVKRDKKAPRNRAIGIPIPD